MIQTPRYVFYVFFAKNVPSTSTPSPHLPRFRLTSYLQSSSVTCCPGFPRKISEFFDFLGPQSCSRFGQCCAVHGREKRALQKPCCWELRLLINNAYAGYVWDHRKKIHVYTDRLSFTKQLCLETMQFADESRLSVALSTPVTRLALGASTTPSLADSLYAFSRRNLESMSSHDLYKSSGCVQKKCSWRPIRKDVTTYCTGCSPASASRARDVVACCAACFVTHRCKTYY